MLRFNVGGKCVPFQGKFLLKKERKGVGELKKKSENHRGYDSIMLPIG